MGTGGVGIKPNSSPFPKPRGRSPWAFLRCKASPFRPHAIGCRRYTASCNTARFRQRHTMSDATLDTSRPQPELLAPAGDWEALRAAVANGADAVYFGLSNFNARHRATNFTSAELPEVMAFLHG